MRYYIQMNKYGLWHWYLLGEEGRQIAGSLQPRRTKQECYDEIRLVKASVNVDIQEV
jgi:uncharacterized protein YegP (UPF0339 family)